MEKLTRGPIIGWHPPQQNCWGICSIPLSLLGASFHLNVRIKVYGAGPRTRSCWDGCRRGRSLPLDGSGITPRKFRKMYYMKFLGFSSRLIAKNAFTPIPHCFWCFALWRNCLPHVLPINGVQLLLAIRKWRPWGLRLWFETFWQQFRWNQEAECNDKKARKRLAY